MCYPRPGTGSRTVNAFVEARGESRETSYGKQTADDLLAVATVREACPHVPHLSAVATCGSESGEHVAAHGSGAQDWSTSNYSGVASRVRRVPLLGFDLWTDQLGPQSAGGGRSHPHAWSPVREHCSGRTRSKGSRSCSPLFCLDNTSGGTFLLQCDPNISAPPL